MKGKSKEETGAKRLCLESAKIDFRVGKLFLRHLIILFSYDNKSKINCKIKINKKIKA